MFIFASYLICSSFESAYNDFRNLRYALSNLLIHEGSHYGQ